MDLSHRFPMALGEAIFTQRAIRRFKPDPIADEDLHDILVAATRAPSGGNSQPWHFIVVRDAEQRGRFAELYREAWWAKRADQGMHGPEDIPQSSRAAMRMADEIVDAPVVVLLCATSPDTVAYGAVVSASQNLLLAARGLGIGGTITTLHATVDQRVKTLFGIPEAARIVYCVPLGYPRGRFGDAQRKPLEEVVSLERWGQPLT